MNFGLKKTEYDPRDYSHAKTFGSMIQILPDEFIVGTCPIKNQMGSEFCTAFASYVLAALEDNVDYSPEWSFQVPILVKEFISLAFGKESFKGWCLWHFLIHVADDFWLLGFAEAGRRGVLDFYQSSISEAFGVLDGSFLSSSETCVSPPIIIILMFRHEIILF